MLAPIAPLMEPGGGHAVTLADPDGRVFRLVYGDEQIEAMDASDMPLRLAHVVLNSSHVEDTRQFMETALDFSMSDRTPSWLLCVATTTTTVWHWVTPITMH